jgi:hypothetical protein
MKNMKLFPVLLLIILFLACDTTEAPECLTAPGSIVEKEISVAPFTQVVVYGKIKLYIEQGPGQKVIIEAGENLFNEVSAEVVEGKLVLKDLSSCTFFQTTYVPKVYVTVPNLTFIENAGNKMIEGVGTLEFPSVRLRSNNHAKDPEVYTNGDFKFNFTSENIYVSGDDFSNFYLTGSTNYLLAQFWAGDGRLEARELTADSIRIFHRGTNKMILNPQQSLKGEIRSTGDVISVNRPPVVEVETFYTGKLIFQ